jgi:hypothetical protein
MPDRRALLTEREREIVAGEADVSDAYRYQTISRVRSRFGRLDDDLAALEAHGELADELRAKVCGSGSGPENDTRDSRPASERRESAQERSVEEADPQNLPAETDSSTDSPASEQPDENAAGSSDSLDWPANKDSMECMNAAAGAQNYIYNHGTATKSEIVKNIMPEYPVGYNADAALEKLESGDRYRGAWWRRVVKPALESDDDIEKPGPGGSEWRYVGSE